MPVNKWRVADYTSDGCSVWQCLKCYNKWEGRDGPCSDRYRPKNYWRYCPYCGTEWGQEQSTTEKIYIDPKPPRFYLVIEEYDNTFLALFGDIDKSAKWKPVYTFNGDRFNARDVYDYLVHLRSTVEKIPMYIGGVKTDQKTDATLWRATIIHTDMIDYPGGTEICRKIGQSS